MAKYLDADGAKIIADEVKKRYQKSSTGIPKTDLASAVQTSLAKADSAVQSESDPTVPAWAKVASKPSYTADEIQNLLKITGLENYYDKSTVDNKLSSIPKFTISVVTSLPSTGNAATVYLVSSGSESQNLYTEYIYVNGKWEILGRQRMDLTGYAKTTDLPTAMTATEVTALFSS